MKAKQYKAILIDWDLLADVDDDNECPVCISTREAMILKALLITAYWPTRWINLGDTPKELQERMARLDGRLDACVNVGGNSYTSSVSFNALFKALFESLWDGSPTDINPDAPTGTWNTGDTDDRNAALCMACMALVDSISAMEAQALSIRYAGFAVVLAGLLLLMPALVTFGVVIFGGLIGSIGYEVAMIALQDRDAKLAVACCMLAGLEGEAVTQAVLEASLDSCGFTPGSNEAIVRDYVAESLTYDATYYAMIDACGRAFVQVSVLGLNLCECGDCGFCGFDSPLSDMCYNIEIGTLGIEGNPANCARSISYPGGGYTYGQRIDVLFTLDEISTINQVTWNYIHGIPAFPAGEMRHTVVFYDDEMAELDDWTVATNTTKDIWQTRVNTGSQANVKYILCGMWFFCNCAGANYIRMDNVRVFCG